MLMVDCCMRPLCSFLFLTCSASNICSGQACVTSNTWNWIGNSGITSPLLATDLVAVKDMFSQSNSKACISLTQNSNKQWVWIDGFCSSDSFKIICQFEDQGIYQAFLFNFINDYFLSVLACRVFYDCISS